MAQDTVFVSNLDQLSEGGYELRFNRRAVAQAFTTGAAVELGSVTLKFREVVADNASNAALSVSLHEPKTNSSGVTEPGTNLGALVGPVTNSNGQTLVAHGFTGELTFKPDSPISLEANTTYFIRILRRGERFMLARTGDDGEDSDSDTGLVH